MTSYQKILINDLVELISSKSLDEIINYETDNVYNKSGVANIIKRYIDLYNEFLIDDFTQNHIVLKFVSVNISYEAYEALSFSTISLTDVIFEKWESKEDYELSSLRKKLKNTFVLIPILKTKIKGKFESIHNWKIGEISVWNPSNDEIKSIEIEWNQSKDIIKKGINIVEEPWGESYRKKNNLPKQSETSFIHLRPHGANSEDYDNKYIEYTKGKIKICKQSYWLNKKFVNKIIKDNKWQLISKEE